MTIITLSNGKKVGNFSSPHPFTFEDGSVLPAVSNEEAERLKVRFIEIPLNDKGDIQLKFALSLDIHLEMIIWMLIMERGEVDVVYCPLPMITAIDKEQGYDFLMKSPFRAIRMEDRIKKLVSINKQCI